MIMSDVDVISQAESVIKSLLHKDKYGNEKSTIILYYGYNGY